MVMFSVNMGIREVSILMALAIIIRVGTQQVQIFTGNMFSGSIFMLLLHFHIWWGLWDLQKIRLWNYFNYVFLLAGPVLLFVAVTIIIPDIQQSKKIDLQQFYFENSSKFFLNL